MELLKANFYPVLSSCASDIVNIITICCSGDMFGGSFFNCSFSYGTMSLFSLTQLNTLIVLALKQFCITGFGILHYCIWQPPGVCLKYLFSHRPRQTLQNQSTLYKGLVSSCTSKLGNRPSWRMTGFFKESQQL